MSKIELPKGFELKFNNAVGVLAETVTVEFPLEFDELATEFHLAGVPAEVFQSLEHSETVSRIVDGKEVEVEVLVKYNGNGNRFEFEAEEGGETEVSREKELNSLKVAELSEIAKELQIEVAGLKKAEIVTNILAAEAKAAETETPTE